MKIIPKNYGYIFQANSYLIVNDSNEAIAVDLGGDYRECVKFLEENNFKLTKILLTHGHFDHIQGVAGTAEATGAEVYIHKDDACMLSGDETCLAYQFGTVVSPVSKYNVFSDGDTIDFSGIPIKVIHTPGHSKGSCTFQMENVLFTGDTLFRLSMGRTDFPDSDDNEMRESLKKLKSMYSESYDYTILPGHNNSSKLSFEVKNNPCL